jgi:TolA-binding protein
MKNYQENIDQIEQYLEGKLEEESKKQFEESIANDKELAKNVETYTFLMDGIKYAGRKNLHEKLKAWDSNMSDAFEDKKASSESRTISWYYVAAAIAFFAVASMVFYANVDTGYEQIVAVHYQPYDHISSGLRGEKDDQNSLSAIFQHYEQGEYNKVIDMINKLDNSTRTEEANFILANSYMSIKQYDEAIILFASISESNSIYAGGSKWYLSLCYLSKEDPHHAIPLLEELTISKTSYASKAKNLLSDIK